MILSAKTVVSILKQANIYDIIPTTPMMTATMPSMTTAIATGTDIIKTMIMPVAWMMP